jgi:hypothetical protein
MAGTNTTWISIYYVSRGDYNMNWIRSLTLIGVGIIIASAFWLFFYTRGEFHQSKIITRLSEKPIQPQMKELSMPGSLGGVSPLPPIKMSSSSFQKEQTSIKPQGMPVPIVAPPGHPLIPHASATPLPIQPPGEPPIPGPAKGPMPGEAAVKPPRQNSPQVLINPNARKRGP